MVPLVASARAPRASRLFVLLGAALAVAASAGCAPASAPAPASIAPHSGHRDGFHHRFDGAKEWAAVFDDPARDAWQKPADVAALLRIAPGMTVVDLGAGTGYFLPHLARAAGTRGKVLALDVEADMVRYMTDRAARDGLTNVTAKLVAGDDPALAPGSVDRILIVDTWHHVSDRARYAKKLHAALAPGGLVVVVDYTRESPHGPPPAHRLAPGDVVAELAAAGLEATIAEETLPHQYVVVGRNGPAIAASSYTRRR